MVFVFEFWSRFSREEQHILGGSAGRQAGQEAISEEVS
jgi:hypothetical protein